MALRLILLGPPASGKGTQGRRVAGREGLGYLSTGALLREAMEAGGELGEEVRPVLARGEYVSDETMCRIIMPWLETNDAKGWVLDGFPRSPAQDDFLTEWLGSRHRRVTAALALEVPKTELVRRIGDRVECRECRWSGSRSEAASTKGCPACGGFVGPREDDDLENFLKRHDEFILHTVPVIERYAAEGNLIRCNATDEIEAVAGRLAEQIDRLKNDGQKA